MLEVKPTGSGHTVNISIQNGNKAIIGATLEAFAMWLHH